jgi:hypothetical protein
MTRHERIALLAVAAMLVLTACSRTGGEEDAAGTLDVATVEAIPGSNVARVILAQEAANRLGIETAPVEDARESETAMPYDAVIYDPTGRTWAYTSPEPLTFVREEIVIDRIRGGTAFLTSGPPVGTQVVTVGASELLGTEYEVAEE